MKKIYITDTEFYKMVDLMCNQIYEQWSGVKEIKTVYGVPRGGKPVAYAVASELDLEVVNDPKVADIIVDDVWCTGKTEHKIRNMIDNQQVPFYPLIRVTNGAWYIFPWEVSLAEDDKSGLDIPTRFLEYIGEDPSRDGLKDTPSRIVKSWDEIYAGYKQDPKQILSKRFDNDEGYNEMVVLRDIEFYSTCEHHALPFFGKAHVAYIPSGKVVGISKLARLVDCFAKRLQIQERMTQQIADSIEQELQPKGVAVMVEAQHLCMVSRGVQKQNSIMVTSALRGCLIEQESRLEFLYIKQ